MRGLVLGGIAAATAATLFTITHDRRASSAKPRRVTDVRKPVVAPDDAPALGNRAAYIPVQCYASTHRADGSPRNSCATCHQASRAPNFVDDADVQTVLSLPAYATQNRWTNALSPPRPVELGDEALLAWIRTDNYRDADLAHTGYDGPPCAFAPDEAGWDRDASGAFTGWRAYAYAPLPGMFWPTNGSAGDAFIRLPAAYRRDASGQPSTAIYALNLAILEATIRRADVAIPPADETALDVDLDGDGRLGTARIVAFAWPPRAGRTLHYVGEAAKLEPERDGWPAAGLFPVGTEIIHSLRYLDVVHGHVRPAARMKEVRYMRKQRWLSYSELDLAAKREQREKEQSPDRLRHVLGSPERGIGTGTGWIMKGFIEAADGTLRLQKLEETTACIGCHGGVGASVDSTFSFARKVPGDRGWFAWGARGFTGIAEPLRADGRGEYRAYLEATGAGDDFASNNELARRVFTPDGSVDPRAARAFAKDIGTLVVPSPQRALALDRAYLAIVRAQSFTLGRDAILGTPAIESRLVQDAATGIAAPLPPPWQTLTSLATPPVARPPAADSPRPPR